MDTYLSGDPVGGGVKLGSVTAAEQLTTPPKTAPLATSRAETAG